MHPISEIDDDEKCFKGCKGYNFKSFNSLSFISCVSYLK